MSKKPAFKSWDQYVKEASKPPFEIPVDDENTITINEPTGAQVIEAQRLAATGDVEAQLRCICGEAADEVVPLILGAPAGVMSALVVDIMRHFGYDAGEVPTSLS